MSQKTTILMIASIAAASLLMGCREGEQDRKLHFEKGVYLGEADQTLTEKQQKSLRTRANYQAQ